MMIIKVSVASFGWGCPATHLKNLGTVLPFFLWECHHLHRTSLEPLRSKTNNGNTVELTHGGVKANTIQIHTHIIPNTQFIINHIKQLQKINEMTVDLLNPSLLTEVQTHKLKRIVPSPNSFFMDIKCPGCFQITTVFSHAQTVVVCGSCNIVLCQPTGGRARLTEGCSYRKKADWKVDGLRNKGILNISTERHFTIERSSNFAVLQNDFVLHSNSFRKEGKWRCQRSWRETVRVGRNRYAVNPLSTLLATSWKCCRRNTSISIVTSDPILGFTSKRSE